VYKRFYGLKRNPFEISPDPFFFYPTPRHNEALASLYCGVQRRKGFVVLSGEVGTGKTLLVRCLLELLNRAGIPFAYIFNPRLSVVEFLQYVMTDLHLRAESANKSEILVRLNDYLIARHNRGSTTVLVVDEAQLLSWELMEEIRLLTNLETTQHKLLQIIMVGQPELDRKMDSADLRQLKQRIGLRCQLAPLTGAEMRGYVLRRLELATANGHSRMIFSEPALAAVEKHSRGIPRLVNTICENALVSGYARQAPVVTAQIVDEIAAEFGFDQPGTGASPRSDGESPTHRVELEPISSAESGPQAVSAQGGRPFSQGQ
jgi:general secretion pathway protein A